MTTILLMLAALGTVFGLRTAKAGWRGGILLLAASGALSIGLAIHRFRGSDANLRAVVSTAVTYGEAAGRKMARETARRHPGARVLILLPPSSSTSDRAISEGFQQEAKSLAIETEEVLLEAPATVRTPIVESMASFPSDTRSAAVTHELENYSRWLTTAILTELLRSWSGRADLVLYLPSLPTDLDKASLLPPGLPRLLVAYVGQDQAEFLLASGFADMAILVNPKTDFWSLPARAPDDVEKAFAQRYRLVALDQSAAHSHPPSPP